MHHTHTLARITLALATPLQLVLVTLVAAARYRQLPCCLMLQTLVFVAFNKVCTAQYFVWYLSLLPLALPSLNISQHRVRVMWCGNAVKDYPLEIGTLAGCQWMLVGNAAALAGMGVCTGVSWAGGFPAAVGCIGCIFWRQRCTVVRAAACVQRHTGGASPNHIDNKSTVNNTNNNVGCARSIHCKLLVFINRVIHQRWLGCLSCQAAAALPRRRSLP